LQEGDADGLMKFIEETCGAAVVEAGKSVDDAFKARSEGGVVVKVGLEGLAGVGEERKEVLEAHGLSPSFHIYSHCRYPF